MEASKTAVTDAEIRAMCDRALEAWNNRDVEAILALLTDDVAWTEAALVEPAHGKAEVAAHLKETFRAFPDLHFAAEEYHVFPDAEQQAVAVEWVMTATMTGPLEGGVPPTGRPVRISGTVVSRMRDGLVHDYVNYYDALGFMQQLGLLPRTQGVTFKAVVMADFLATRAKRALHI